MMLEFTKPRLRALDIRPHRQDGLAYFLLRDPQQLSEQVLLVPQPLGLLLLLCDGTRELDKLATDFMARSGITVSQSVITKLVVTLDEALMLDNARTAQAHAHALTAYRQMPFRRPALAGKSYPAEAGQLWRLLQNYLASAEGITPLEPTWPQRIGLLSPHIDYPRGGAVYAQVWQRAAQVAREADVVVLLGTDHYGNDPFTLTRQNYATPYGLLPTAQSIVDRLAKIIGEEAAFAGELRHQGEHSLELVAVWLHHMRNQAPVDLVPILVGGFQNFLGKDAAPVQDRLITQVLETLRASTQGRRVLVVASGDLAHVGPAFNGPSLDQIGRKQIQAADQELIAHMQAGDPEKFFTSIKQIGDCNNVCGVSPIYLALHTLGAVQGEPMGYATCPADAHDTSIVTVCGMIFN